MNRNKWLGIMLLGLLITGCAGKRPTQAELPLLPEKFQGKIWMVNHWAGRDAAGLPGLHFTGLVTQMSAGDGGGASLVATQFDAKDSVFRSESAHYPNVIWSDGRRWPVYCKLVSPTAEPRVVWHLARNGIFLAIEDLWLFEHQGVKKEPLKPLSWAQNAGGIWTIPPVYSPSTGAYASVSVFPLGNEELDHGTTRYFLEWQDLSHTFHWNYGLIGVFGDPIFTESLTLETDKPAVTGNIGLKWEAPKSDGFEPATFPSAYPSVPDQGWEVILRKRDQSIRMAGHELWMGAIEVRTTQTHELIGFGNLCMMTRK